VRLTPANGIIGFLTLVLAMFSVSMLASYREYVLSEPVGGINAYFMVVYGYWAIVVPLAGLAIGVLTFMQKRRIWIANLVFQVITIIALLSTVFYFGLGLEYNSGISTRNFSLGLSIILLFLVVMLNKRQTSNLLTRAGNAIYARNKKAVSLVAILLILAFGLGLFDPLLSHSDLSYSNVKHPSDPEIQFMVIVKQTSPTLAANTPATIEILMSPNPYYGDQNNLARFDNLPDEFFVIFEDTNCGTPFEIGRLCMEILPRVDDSRYFARYDRIVYGHGGDYNMTLATGFGFEDNRSVTEKPVIHIAPIEATNEYRTFIMSIIIGIIASAIGFYALFQKKPQQF
jgi:hypothetical protein